MRANSHRHAGVSVEGRIPLDDFEKWLVISQRSHPPNPGVVKVAPGRSIAHENGNTSC